MVVKVVKDLVNIHLGVALAVVVEPAAVALEVAVVTQVVADPMLTMGNMLVAVAPIILD